ncbi:hypothetical protein [Rhodococcus sp. ACS1]|nr:hypothetical protein [Rhodococcus sp. ACS1]
MGNRAIAETVVPAALATTPSRARNDAAACHRHGVFGIAEFLEIKSMQL